MTDQSEIGMGEVIRIDEARIGDYLGEMVRGTVENAHKGMLDAEAHPLGNAGRYKQTAARRDRRSGICLRALETRVGKLNPKVPKLRRQTVETAIVEHDQQRQTSIDEAPIEMHLAGVPVSAPDRRHHQGVVEHVGQSENGLKSRPEELRHD